MTQLTFGPTRWPIPRDALLIDTNVLVALSDSRDEHHIAASLVPELGVQLLVPVAVAVEAFGVVQGRERHNAFQLLRWLATPGNAELVDSPARHVDRARIISERFRVDLVDALLVVLAQVIGDQCGFDEGIAIATFDLRDFGALRGSVPGFRVYDPENLQVF